MGKKSKNAKTEKKAKKPRFKPKGMRWVNPFLTVKDVDGALAWYERALGFETTLRVPGPDGKTVHAEIRYRKSALMLAPESADGKGRAPGSEGGAAVTLYCYCPDVDAVTASAKAAGARVLEEPTDQFWGDRTCFFVDPYGHQWMFATHGAGDRSPSHP